MKIDTKQAPSQTWENLYKWHVKGVFEFHYLIYYYFYKTSFLIPCDCKVEDESNGCYKLLLNDVLAKMTYESTDEK